MIVHPRRHTEHPTLEVSVHFVRVRQSPTHSFYRCTWEECEDPLNGYRHFSIDVLLPINRQTDPKPIFSGLALQLAGKEQVNA